MESQVLAQLERWYHRGEFGRIVYTCDKLLSQPQHAALKPHILFWKGNAHERAGRAWQGDAIYCYREGIASAGRDRAIKVRLMACLGKVYSDSGDCTSFERLLPEFERTSRQRGSAVVRWSAFVWFNYGVTLDNAFRYSDAAEAYSRAAALSAESKNMPLLGQCLHNLGGVYLELGKLPQAAAVMAQAEELLPDELAGHKKLSRRAEYYLAAGDLVSAQQSITAALVHPLIDDSTKADVYLTWARTSAALQRDSEAQEKAMLALDHAVTAVNYPCVHRVNRFLQKQNGIALSS